MYDPKDQTETQENESNETTNGSQLDDSQG